MNNWNFDEFLNYFFYLVSFNNRFLNNDFYRFYNFLKNWYFFQYFNLNWWLSDNISNFHYFLNDLWNLDNSIFNFNYRNYLFNDSIDRFIFGYNLVLDFRSFIVDRFLNNYFFYFLNFNNFWNFLHDFLYSINDNFDRFQYLNNFLCRNNFFLFNYNLMILRDSHNYLFLNLNNFLNFYDLLYNPINIL